MIAPYSGRLVSIDNRKLATVAKLAGAPVAKAAGVALQCRLNQMVDAGAPCVAFMPRAQASSTMRRPMP
jgi:thymidine phosphorylase